MGRNDGRRLTKGKSHTLEGERFYSSVFTTEVLAWMDSLAREMTLIPLFGNPRNF